MREITLSTTALASLIDRLPAPDDPEPRGTGAPVIHWLERVGLNPQPLPPRVGLVFQAVVSPHPILAGPSPEPWGPHPEPWAWSALARAAISRHLAQFEAAGIIIVSGDLGDALRRTSESLIAFADEICGTRPRPHPFPGPWGPLLDPATLHPLNILVAGVQFQRAADALDEHPLHDTLEQCADRIVAASLSRFADQ